MATTNWASVANVPVSQEQWGTTAREPSNDLDRQAFLNLLITQLQNQDPLNPMDDRDFIAQMAQFSALEQMMNLNATFERTQAFGMIGKVIDASFFCETSDKTINVESALVTSVIRDRDSVFLVVEGEYGQKIDVPFNAVREVSEDFFLSHQLDAIFVQVQGQRAADMVGRHVMGFAVVGDNLEFVEGKVDSVLMDEATGVTILAVGNSQLVFPRDVFHVSGENRLVGSPHFFFGSGDSRIGVSVTGVDVRGTGSNQRLYLRYSNGESAHVSVINHVIDALTYVNQPIAHGTTSGTVDGIVMRAGVPFVVLREGGEINFVTYMNQRAGRETTEGDSDD